MNKTQQKVVQYLDEAHSSKQALVRVLQAQIAITPRGSYRTGLESHLDETRDHAARICARLKELGQSFDPLLAFVGLTESLLGQALAFGKTPFDLLRNCVGDEKILENAKDACANEAFEIATYTAIEHLARSVGDDETATLAASIRADEQQMLERIIIEIPNLTATVVGADLNGGHSGDVSAPGAVEAVREAGDATEDGARETTVATKRTARQARKVPGEAQRNGQLQSASAASDDLAIARYDTLTADQITRRLAGLSQADLAKIESYERKDQNRAMVLSRIASLRGNETSAAGVPAGANDAGAVSDVHDDLRAAAAAGDGAAAFTLSERLRDTDFAAAEGWLRTAVELGDVRAAYRLGMLLWERRDVDAAEAMLRQATVDPQAAYALGLLLWRERSDPQAAVEWLDRAARADDPAAERDLGIVLREHGDLQGAHHWLSRAAERDDEARLALAELV